jgi:hypothetical protein
MARKRAVAPPMIGFVCRERWLGHAYYWLRLPGERARVRGGSIEARQSPKLTATE